MGFDFTVGYRVGKESIIADVFSRQIEDTEIVATITMPQLGKTGNLWSMKDGLTFYKKRIYLQPTFTNTNYSSCNP